jgi:hypothetical protein
MFLKISSGQTDQNYNSEPHKKQLGPLFQESLKPLFHNVTPVAYRLKILITIKIKLKKL